MILRLATQQDFQTFFGREAPAVFTALTASRGTAIVGIGGVAYSEQGEAIGFLDLRERLPAIALHRAARRFLAVLKEVGEPSILTYCDDALPLAKKWLTHLGFIETSTQIEGRSIWQWQP